MDSHRELTPLEAARQRLAEEIASQCAVPADVDFWRAEVRRLEREAKGPAVPARRGGAIK